MPDYASNSHRSKEGGTGDSQRERPRIEKITDAEIVKRRKGPWRSIKGIIVAGDMSHVGQYLWIEWIVPGIRNLLFNTIEQAAEKTIFGDRRPGPYHRPTSSPSQALGIGRERGSVVNYVPYSDMSRGYSPDPRGMPQLQQPMVVMDERGYRIRSKEKAVETLNAMAFVIDRYEVVTVADLHDMLDLPSTPMENRWGWIDVRDARIRQLPRDAGWMLELPEPEELPA